MPKKKSKSKVVFSIVPVVSVAFMGRKEHEGSCSIPACRDDGGLLFKFLEFLKEKKIRPAIQQYCREKEGCGFYINFFTPKDAARIEEWLIKNGAKVR